MSGRGNFRPMPEDFAEHAHESQRELIKRYRSSQETVTRWKMIAGTWHPKERPVIRTDWEGNERIYPSIQAAARATRRATPSNIVSAIKRGGTSAGHWWRYAETGV